jgi:hypothetical protein
VLLVGTAGLFWWVGCEYAQQFRLNPVGKKNGYFSPSERIPGPSPVAQANNKAAELRLPVNLEGTAVAYPEEVAALVSADGKFHTELSLKEMAGVLRVDPRTIAKRGSRTEVDPEAVLFQAVTGRLSERAKVESRRLRATDEQGLGPVMDESDQWVTVEYRFTLNSLRHPSPVQELILDAISRSARGLMREPGAKVNAVPLPFPVFNFAGGYLPLEPLSVDQ